MSVWLYDSDSLDKNVRAYIEENYPGFEIVSISQDGDRYLVRIREVIEE